MLIVGLFQTASLPAATTPEANPVPVKKEKKIADPRGKRASSQVLLCYISREDGVQLPGVGEGEIILFELLDSDGEPIMTFTDEISFVETFFSSLPEVSGVRFETTDYIFIGFI